MILSIVFYLFEFFRNNFHLPSELTWSVIIIGVFSLLGIKNKDDKISPNGKKLIIVVIFIIVIFAIYSGIKYAIAIHLFKRFLNWFCGSLVLLSVLLFTIGMIGTYLFGGTYTVSEDRQNHIIYQALSTPNIYNFFSSIFLLGISGLALSIFLILIFLA